MIKQYGKKQVKFTFHFNKNGKNIIEILEKCYQNEIRNEQILTRENHEVQKLENNIM